MAADLKLVMAADVNRISVLDARALGDPGFLGEARINVASLALEPNSPPVNLWLPLKVPIKLPCWKHHVQLAME